jgi:hypothetical protein
MVVYTIKIKKNTLKKDTPLGKYLKIYSLIVIKRQIYKNMTNFLKKYDCW